MLDYGGFTVLPFLSARPVKSGGEPARPQAGSNPIYGWIRVRQIQNFEKFCIVALILYFSDF